jgi:putative peptidoglycan lipid II flippase
VSKALLVATGILLSRLAGLIRLRVFAHYFGLQSDAADAFNAGFRIPNLLQNLFGEGALSASFIPVYASLVARGRREDADRVAGAVGALLALIVAAIVLVGVLAAPFITALVAPGFTGEKRELTIAIVRILFPGAGLLVLSAWCLGILNSHNRFLLSYTAPVMWNAAMIATLVAFGGDDLPRLAVWLAWGSVIGSALQVIVQVPVVLRVAPQLRLVWDRGSGELRSVGRNFVPVLISRGVVQVSAYVDALIASLLPTGAVTGFTNAQLLFTLPVSLFGMSVAAAELPALSGEAVGGGPGHEALRARLNAGLRQIAFFIVPSAVAFAALGDVIAAALLQTGRFRYEDAVYVWLILAGSSIGLLSSTLGRLYASTYYALRDTRTPLRYALVHVGLATVLGYVFAIVMPPQLGVPRAWGAAGLTASAGLAGWVDMLLLRHTLNRRIGETGLPIPYTARLWSAGIVAAAIAWAIKLALPPLSPILIAAAVLVPYGLSFIALARALGIPEASLALQRLTVIRRRIV